MLDNIFVERLWRSLKYEYVYSMNFASVEEARHHIGGYFKFYNEERPQQSLGYKTPIKVYKLQRGYNYFSLNNRYLVEVCLVFEKWLIYV